VPYFQLSDPATSERLMRELASSACSAFGLQMTETRLVGHSENIVCRVTANAEGQERHYALRVSNPDHYSTAQIEAECAWVSAIARDTPVRCVAPLATSDGRHVVELPIHELGVLRRCSVFPWIAGEQVGEPRPDHLRKLGETTAALHNHADVYSHGEPVDRPVADWAALLGPFLRGDITAAWEDHPGPATTDDDRAVFADAAARLRHEVESIATGTDYGLIHADLHFGNVVCRDGELWPIDFDDCHHAHYMTDVATTLFQLHRSDGKEESVDAYIEAYAATRPLPADWRAQVATFSAARCFTAADWVLGWRREDHMGSATQALTTCATQLRDYVAGLV
jgi:Ser/Thr protein kinase RdoA (MazF antagonist)